MESEEGKSGLQESTRKEKRGPLVGKLGEGKTCRKEGSLAKEKA